MTTLKKKARLKKRYLEVVKPELQKSLHMKIQ